MVEQPLKEDLIYNKSEKNGSGPFIFNKHKQSHTGKALFLHEEVLGVVLDCGIGKRYGKGARRGRLRATSLRSENSMEFNSCAIHSGMLHMQLFWRPQEKLMLSLWLSHAAVTLDSLVYLSKFGFEGEM